MKEAEGALRPGLFKGQVFVITGGGTGLGRAMALYLLQLGAHIAIASRNQERLERAATEMQSETGGIVLPVACDVRQPEQVEQLLEAVLSRFGQVNGLINNAAGNFISPTVKLSANAFSTVIDIVLKGTTNCSLVFGKYWMKHKQEASVLNIVTTYAFTGSAFVVPSAVAKAGVLALTRSLAVEWGAHGIRTNCIAPGPFPTPGAWERLLPGHLADSFNPAERVPLGRVGKHEELANLVAFILSPQASFINGECITIDGGEWLQGAGQFNDLRSLKDDDWEAIREQMRK